MKFKCEIKKYNKYYGLTHKKGTKTKRNKYISNQNIKILTKTLKMKSMTVFDEMKKFWLKPLIHGF